MRKAEVEAEQRAIVARAAALEARMQDAIADANFAAVRDYEVELSRLWSRFMDLDQGAEHVA
jgi:hypothetical protein